MFNIFTLVFLAIIFALGLAVFVTRRAPKPATQLVPPEEDLDKDDPSIPKLTLKELAVLGERLCQENHLTIKERIALNETETYWVTESTNEFFMGNYVLGFLETTDAHPYATMSNVLEFKDFIKSVSSTKGYFFTTGYFTRDVHQPLEGPRVALYNRRKILEEFKRLSIPWP